MKPILRNRGFKSGSYKNRQIVFTDLPSNQKARKRFSSGLFMSFLCLYLPPSFIGVLSN